MVFSIVAIPVFIPTNCVQGFLISAHFTSTCYLISVRVTVIKKISHCGFDLHFSD